MSWQIFLDKQSVLGYRVLVRRASTGKYLVMRLTKLEGMNSELFWLSENDRFVGVNPRDMWIEFEQIEWDNPPVSSDPKEYSVDL